MPPPPNPQGFQLPPKAPLATCFSCLCQTCSPPPPSKLLQLLILPPQGHMCRLNPGTILSIYICVYCKMIGQKLQAMVHMQGLIQGGEGGGHRGANAPPPPNPQGFQLPPKAPLATCFSCLCQTCSPPPSKLLQLLILPPQGHMCRLNPGTILSIYICVCVSFVMYIL